MIPDYNQSSSLKKVSAARKALSNTDDIEKVLAIRDIAKTAAVFADAQNASEAANEAKEVQLRAERKAGALFGDMEKSNGGRPKNSFQIGTSFSEYALALEETGTPKVTAYRWQKIAKITDEEFEEFILETIEAGKELTQAGLLRRLKQNEKQEKREAKRILKDERLDLPEDSCQIFQADIKEAHNHIEPASIDCIITDPPYPKEYLYTYQYLAKFASQVLKPGGSLLVMCGQSYLPEIFKLMCPHITYNWVVAYLTPGGQSPQIWPRKVNTFWKPVLWFTNGEYSGDWIGDVSQSGENDKRFHHWGQSESGMADLIERFTYPGQIVCDPFLGGGTTAVVSADMGRLFVGSDISEDAINQTKERMAL